MNPEDIKSLDNSLNLLVVGINYSPEHSGIAPYTSAMSSELKALGNNVVVFTAQPHYPAWKIFPGFRKWKTFETVNKVALFRFLHYVPAKPNSLRRLFSEVTFGARVAAQKLGRQDVVLLVSPALFSSFLVMLRVKLTHPNARIVVWVQDLYAKGYFETTGRAGMLYKVLSLVEGFLLRSSSHVVVVHDSFRTTLEEDFDIHPDNVSVVKNWAHSVVENETAQSNRSVFNWPDDKTVVLHTGNMGKKQGLKTVVDAAKIAEARNLDILFVLVGDGSERNDLREYAVGLSHVVFIDPVDTKVYSDMLKSADILLVNELPGVSNMSVPSKLTSYFQSGRPIIACTSAFGSTALEVSRSGAGLVVEAGSAEMLVDSVRSLSQDTNLQDELGQMGLDYFRKELTLEQAIRSMQKILNSQES